MSGNSPARAFNRNWYYKPPTTPHVAHWQSGIGNIEKENILTYPTQTKLAHHTTSTASNRTTVFDRRRPRVATEAIQLELRLVAHLPPGREDFGCVQRRGMRGARSRC